MIYIIQFVQRFCTKYFLRNRKIFIGSHSIAQNVQQGLVFRMRNQLISVCSGTRVTMLQWEKYWENVVFFSKSWGFFLKISFFHSNLLGSRRIWMKNSHFDEYILNYWWKWEHFLISSVYEEVFFTAFSLSYLAVHFSSLNKNRGVYQNSVKSILYKSVVQI